MTSRRIWTRRSALSLFGTALIAACGGAASPTAAPTKPTEAPKPTTAPAAAATKPAAAASPAAGGAPAANPLTEASVIDAAKKENKLLIYSIMSKENWQPVLDG